MADYYWVGDSGDWSDYTNHWSSMSGGSPDTAGYPSTDGDNVYFDNSSFSGNGETVTLDVDLLYTYINIYMLSDPYSFTFAMGTNDISVRSWQYDGYVSFSTGAANPIDIDTSSGGVFGGNTSNVFPRDIYLFGNTAASPGGYSFGGNFGTNDIVIDTAGVTNDYCNIICNQLSFADTDVGAVRLGGYDLICNNIVSTSSSTLDIALSTSGDIYLKENAGGNCLEIWDDFLQADNIYVEGNSIVYSHLAGELQIQGTFHINSTTGSGQVTFTGGLTFDRLSIDSHPKTVQFEAGKTYYIDDNNSTPGFVATGASGQLITLLSSSAGTPFTFETVTDGQNITCDYLSIKDSTVVSTDSWNAGANSTDVSGNTGWNFGGEVYSKNFTESVVLTSPISLAKVLERLFSETASVSDTLTNIRGKLFIESLALSDSRKILFNGISIIWSLTKRTIGSWTNKVRTTGSWTNTERN